MEPGHRQYQWMYKYVPFNPGSLCILTEGTMKFSSPFDFNDPFDCLPVYTRNLREIRKRNRKIITRSIAHVNAGRKLSPGAKIQQRGKFARKMRKVIHTDEWHRNLLVGTGICSLSDIPDNILMWSHYAEFHRGFVVGFRVNWNEMDPTRLHSAGLNLITQEVTYSKHRPEVMFASDSNTEFLGKLLLTKALPWEYESEQRVIDMKRGPGIHPYKRDELLGCVIAGARMPAEHACELQRIVRELRQTPALSHLTFHQATISHSDYKIDIPDFDNRL